MSKNMRTGLVGLLLAIVLTAGFLAVPARAAEPENRFVLVAEAGGKLVIAPEYVSYEPEWTIREALGNSGHSFIGLNDGLVTAIDDVAGSYTRSDQNGSYELTIKASDVTHYRFSETPGSSQPSEGLMLLMTAMADYLEKDEDVRSAAKESYKKAYQAFVGLTSENAKLYAGELNAAMQEYEDAQNGEKYSVSFQDGGTACSAGSYAGLSLTAVNQYGKTWQDDNGDGVLELPKGSYSFHVAWNGLHAQGALEVSQQQTVTLSLPGEAVWLNTDAFRLSGSYDGDERSFEDSEFALGSWSERKLTVPVPDNFTGAVYTYAEFNKDIFSEEKLPALTAVYTMRNAAATEMEKDIAFESRSSGAYSVLAAESRGNTVIYRISSVGGDGYTYAQDYTVAFDRIPTLKAISLCDQEGTDQAATDVFRGHVTSYDYNVLDTVTAVTVSAEPFGSDYQVSVDNAVGNTVAVSGETTVTVRVSANGYSNVYMLNIHPGEGHNLFFVSASDVTVEVINKNGVVMPFTTHRPTPTTNRYQYVLVPGDEYSYVATYNEHYHIADDFTLESVTNKTISISFDAMGDWLEELAFGVKMSKDHKGDIPLNRAFDPTVHSYEASFVDTSHLAYVWVSTASDVSVQAMYSQIHAGQLYHGVPLAFAVESGSTTGTQLKRFLMNENPHENTVTFRLSREDNGVTYYQDYVTKFKRELTLKGITAQCDNMDTVLVRPDGTLGFDPQCREYTATVSMAARQLVLFPVSYSDNLCYGEEGVGYRINANGQTVESGAPVVIELDGTLNTQQVAINVENDKAPDGTAQYLIHIQKSPPVAVTFQTEPASALLHITETLSGNRLWPDENGVYMLCEGYSYAYALTSYGYVGKAGTLEVTRSEEKELVILDGETTYTVEETVDGGAVSMVWTLHEAPANNAINGALGAMWPNFRGNNSNNSVTDAPLPVVAEEGSLYWATQLGSGYDADAVGSPILVDGDLITYGSDNLYRIDTMTGEVKASAKMDHKSAFSITPPTHWGGMIFVALSDGSVQAFNALTLESLWLYRDPLRGQPNCPITVVDGYLYTGFWNSETGNANFVCLSVTDEDPTNAKEGKSASWYYTNKGGYYWAGACVRDGYVIVGTDDGTATKNSPTARLLLLDAATGRLCDSWNGLKGDIRSTIAYADGAYYFTSKGGCFYGVRVDGESGTFYDGWSVDLANGNGNTAMSTSSPSVYNGRAYIGLCGDGQFAAYSGHGIGVIDLTGRYLAYSVPTQGYPQTSGLLTTAYQADTGYVYIYFFDNYTPGKLRVMRDRPGQTAADYLTTERGGDAAYALFTPTGEHAQYAICSPISDEYGTVYFKNDSAHLMAFGSAVERIKIETEPTKMTYVEGEKFDPTGMKVVAVYKNGLSRDVSRYVTCSENELTAQNPVVTVSFPYGLYHNAPSKETPGGMDSGVETTTPYVELEVTVKGGTPGDVNDDGSIDSQDAQRILDYEAGVPGASAPLGVADVSGDGVADSNDAVLILQYAEKLIDKFPVDKTEKAAENE
ncbi:MAG: PQQ-binding-like beta-propeller repeat protein [Oscillospiraceae bacterium]|nr:PQQ-binding-like beta-propeller repeat protein [Oscillospiraceae bacterium]